MTGKASQSNVGAPANEVEELRARVSQLEQQVAEKEELAKRARADYLNLEHRFESERLSFVTLANQALMQDILPTLDHLELALQHFADPSLQMIVNDFKKTLEKNGLRMTEVIGKPFDPHTMEAAATAPGEKDQVVAVQRAGYQLGSSVLRPASVVVGSGESN